MLLTEVHSDGIDSHGTEKEWLYLKEGAPMPSGAFCPNCKINTNAPKGGGGDWFGCLPVTEGALLAVD